MDMIEFRREALNEAAAEIHAANKKWWTDLETGEPVERNKGQMFMLMASEVAEAMEGERKDLMDDHLPHRKMAEVEMADLIIRLFDFCGGFGYELHPVEYEFRNKPDRGERLWQIVKLLTYADEAVKNHSKELAEDNLSRVVAAALTYCNDAEYNLWAAVREKHAYNKVRADHKAENRKKDGGKKW